MYLALLFGSVFVIIAAYYTVRHITYVPPKAQKQVNQ